jgi:hypothetical protein
MRRLRPYNGLMKDPTPDKARIGRRALARMLAATAAGAAAPSVSAQAPAQTPVDPFLRQAREDRLDDARQIAKIPLPLTIEPAFRFKA